MRGLVRLAPIFAGGVLIAAALSRLLGFSNIVPIALLGAGILGLGAAVWIQTRRRHTTDAIAAAVDADASLAGELRSAHWFEAAGSGDEWAQFHIARASERVQSIDWTGLYPRVRGGRSWALTATLAAAAIVLSVGVPARHIALATTDTAAAGAPGDPLSAELRAKLNALLAQMELGKLSAEEARNSLAELKDLLAKIDPKLQDKLDEMLKKAELSDAPKGKELNAKDLAEGAKQDGSGMPKDMKKALEEIAQRLNKNDQGEKQASNSESAQPSSENNESGAAGEKSQGQGQPTDMKAAAAQGSMQMVREAATDPSAGKMMMGGGMMGGDSKSGVGGNKTAETGAAEALLVAQALRKELIEANDDIQGKNVLKEDIRRKTEQGKSTLGFTHVAPTAFERSRADAPPPVPEARRPLMQQYFIRK